MPNEKKKSVLNDDELEKVNGGYTYAVTSLEGGDVFIYNSSPNMGLIVATDVVIENDDTLVPYYDIFESEHGWKKGSKLYTDPIRRIITIATFSKELSGRI